MRDLRTFLLISVLLTFFSENINSTFTMKESGYQGSQSNPLANLTDKNLKSLIELRIDNSSLFEYDLDFLYTSNLLEWLSIFEKNGYITSSILILSYKLLFHSRAPPFR